MHTERENIHATPVIEKNNHTFFINKNPDSVPKETE
jgi:hypothetical protein